MRLYFWSKGRMVYLCPFSVISNSAAEIPLFNLAWGMWVLLECLSRRKNSLMKNERHTSSNYIVFMVGQSIKANQ